MTATFIWPPDTGAEKDMEPRVISVGFGDGYSQDAPDGINSTLQKRALTFSGRSLTEVDAIDAFLTARNGVERFYFTYPRDIQRLWKCKAWSVRESSSVSGTLSATFEEVPA